MHYCARGYVSPEPPPKVAGAPGFITQPQANLIWKLWYDHNGSPNDLIAALGDAPRARRIVRFPEHHGSTYLRQRRERAALIRHLTCSGFTVRDTARTAQVHSRTVTQHRARMRAEGQFPDGGAYGQP